MGSVVGPFFTRAGVGEACVGSFNMHKENREPEGNPKKKKVKNEWRNVKGACGTREIGKALSALVGGGEEGTEVKGGHAKYGQ